MSSFVYLQIRQIFQSYIYKSAKYSKAIYTNQPNIPKLHTYKSAKSSLHSDSNWWIFKIQSISFLLVCLMGLSFYHHLWNSMPWIYYYQSHSEVFIKGLPLMIAVATGLPLYSSCKNRISAIFLFLSPSLSLSLSLSLFLSLSLEIAVNLVNQSDKWF